MHIFCSFCGAANAPQTRFCTSCRKLIAAATMPQPPPLPFADPWLGEGWSAANSAYDPLSAGYGPPGWESGIAGAPVPDTSQPPAYGQQTGYAPPQYPQAPSQAQYPSPPYGQPSYPPGMYPQEATNPYGQVPGYGQAPQGLPRGYAPGPYTQPPSSGAAPYAVPPGYAPSPYGQAPITGAAPYHGSPPGYAPGPYEHMPIKGIAPYGVPPGYAPAPYAPQPATRQQQWDGAQPLYGAAPYANNPYAVGPTYYSALPALHGPGTPAGFFPRLGAAVVDWCVLAIPWIFFVSLASGLGSGGLVLLTMLLVPALYYIGFWSTSGRTPGHRAAGLQMISVDATRPTLSACTLRYFGALLSAMCLYLGYFSMLWDDSKQTWHDKMARTVVIHS